MERSRIGGATFPPALASLDRGSRCTASGTRVIGRRDFIALLGGAVVAWPLAARAQQAKMPTIGFLGTGTPASMGTWVAAFVQRLRELGWVEGRSIVLDYRWAEGRSERISEIAAEFVRRKVDVILALGTEAALAAKQATTAIPIVFPISVDPVGAGLVASLARPGGNLTGLANLASDIAAKRLELMREMIPRLGRLAILANAGFPSAALEIVELQTAARTLGLDIIPLSIRRTDDIAPAFESLQGRADAMYVVGDPLINANRVRINTFALAARLPTAFVNREHVDVGGLMSYGPNFPDLNRRAADYVDKILRGAKPGDLPVEQPTKFDLVVNLITARALGITVPPTLLARADEVIE
jgi:putative tryptophan/tyrosine transport system substrate-binding protein